MQTNIDESLFQLQSRCCVVFFLRFWIIIMCLCNERRKNEGMIHKGKRVQTENIKKRMYGGIV